MPYIQETVLAGKTIEIRKYYSGKYGKRGYRRAENENATPEDVAEINERNAEMKLRRLINSNFGEGDMHLVYTYTKDNRPPPKEAAELLKKHLRELRKLYKNNGLELKYVSVTEYESKAIHHHLIVNAIDCKKIQKIWLHGKVRPTYLDGTGQYGKLAAYFIKETKRTVRNLNAPSAKRWNSSRNLIKPQIDKKIVPADSWMIEPRVPKGYMLEKDSVEQDFDCFGRPWMKYSMRKLE